MLRRSRGPVLVQAVTASIVTLVGTWTSSLVSLSPCAASVASASPSMEVPFSGVRGSEVSYPSLNKDTSVSVYVLVVAEVGLVGL